MDGVFHIGIIGLGGIARKWADDVQKYLPKAKIYAVCSRDAANAEEFARTYEVPHHCSSIDLLLNLPDLHLVYIANPHPDHYAAALSCLDSGIAVLCEKPMAMHFWQVEALVAKSCEKQVFLMEAIWSRFIPAFHHTLALVASEAIGKVHTITADFGFRATPDGKPRLWQKALGAGSLLDIGLYPILLTQYLLGQPDTIQANATFTEQYIDDSCQMLFGWNGGQRAILLSTLRTTTPTDAWIHGTEGSIYLHSRFHHPYQMTVQRGAHLETFDMPYSGHGYHFEAAAAIEAIRSGAIEHPLVSHAFSLQLSETLGRVMGQIGLQYS
jgi:predicted dehydrogenase